MTVGSDHLRVIPIKQSLVLAKIGDFTRIQVKPAAIILFVVFVVHATQWYAV